MTEEGVKKIALFCGLAALFVGTSAVQAADISENINIYLETPKKAGEPPRRTLEAYIPLVMSKDGFIKFEDVEGGIKISAEDFLYENEANNFKTFECIVAPTSEYYEEVRDYQTGIREEIKVYTLPKSKVCHDGTPKRKR